MTLGRRAQASNENGTPAARRVRKARGLSETAQPPKGSKMNRNASSLLITLSDEASAVLATLAGGPDEGLRQNDLSGATGLPTGHIGRHLRTLERDRLARYSAGAWLPTLRGMHHLSAQPAKPTPLSA